MNHTNDLCFCQCGHQDTQHRKTQLLNTPADCRRPGCTCRHYELDFIMTPAEAKAFTERQDPLPLQVAGDWI